MKGKLALAVLTVGAIGMGIGSGSAAIFAQAKPGAAAKSAPAAKGAPAAPGKYAALAVDRAQGFVYGFSFDQSSRGAAAQVALDECSKRNGKCGVVVEISGPGCVAYRAIDPSAGTAYGWGTAPTQSTAEQRANQECVTFAGRPGICGNHVWACNSEDTAAYKILRNEPVQRAKAPGDCLIQYQANLDNSQGRWVSRIYSPVYRLTASDCPLTGAATYTTFLYAAWPGSAPSQEQRSPGPGPYNPVLKSLGSNMVKDFYNWNMARQAPVAGLRFQPESRMNSGKANEENLASMLRQVGKRDAGDSAGYGDGVCLQFAPSGVMPVEILGADQCRRWVR